MAAAVGVDAVKHWTGRKEHRGQLSSAMTAKGTVSIGSQYADPHGVGVIGGTLSAREHAAARAKTEQLSAEARKANTILAQVGMHVRQRDKLLSETFVDMDLNQHGSLSYQELRGGLDRIGVHLNNDEYSLLLSKVDADNNGRIEFQEFAKAIKADVRDTAMPTPMTGPVVGSDGQPIRVGMSLTTTDKNNSHQVNEILQMAPATLGHSVGGSSSTSWLSEQEHTLQEGSPGKRTGMVCLVGRQNVLLV